MLTQTKRTILTAALALLCSACEGKAPPKDIDAVWGDLTSDERVAHLEGELEAAEAELREAANVEEWDLAHQRGVSALSLLRPEIWTGERERYVELEVELDALARTTRDAL